MPLILGPHMLPALGPTAHVFYVLQTPGFLEIAEYYYYIVHREGFNKKKWDQFPRKF